MMRKKIPILLIFVIVLLLYYPSFSVYFSQDDFFMFKVSQTNGTLGEFVKLFGIYPYDERGIAFYRPVSRELIFNLYYSTFGLNHIPFRIFQFFVHFLNITLVFFLVEKLFSKKRLPFFVSFFFGITAANVATLYYLAGGIQTLLSTTFTLSALLLYIRFMEKKNTKFIILSFVAFLLGLSSHEQSVIIPILLLSLAFILSPQKEFKKNLVYLLPFLLTALVFIFFDITKIGFSSLEKQYQPIFNIKTFINSFAWYSGWALGLPETLIDFVLPGLKLNPTLLRYWNNYYLFIFPSFFMSVALILFATVYLFIRKRAVFKNKAFLFSLIWFPLGILPVVFLPLHKSTHYLVISLTPFWTILSYIAFSFYEGIRKKYPMVSKFFLFLLILSLITLSTASAILGSSNYWAASRGKVALRILKDVKEKYPTLPKGSTIYFENDPNYPQLTQEWGGTSKQASIALNGNDALQLVYKDNTLNVFYEDTGEIPKDFPKEKIYPLVAKIN